MSNHPLQDTYNVFKNLGSDGRPLQVMKREADELVSAIRSKGFDIERSLETSQSAKIFVRHHPVEIDGHMISLYEQLLATSCYILADNTDLNEAQVRQDLAEMGFSGARKYMRYLYKNDTDYVKAASYRGSSDTVAVVKIPEEIWSEIEVNALLYPIKAKSVGVALSDLRATITHEMTHAYIKRNTHHRGKRQVFGEVEEAAASAVSEVLNEDKSIFLESYQPTEDREGKRKKVLATYLHAFADIAEDRSRKNAVDKIRRQATAFIEELQENPEEEPLNPLREVSGERYEMIYTVIEAIARSEKLTLHPLSMLNLLEPQYFKHVRRLGEDLELSVYLEEEEAFPSSSLVRGSGMSGADLDIDLDDDLGDELSAMTDDLELTHRGNVEDFIEDLRYLPSDYSELSEALETIIEIWHKGDKHLEDLEEEEENLIRKFDGNLQGAKELMAEGGSIAPNEVEKRFPEEDMETVLKTFLSVHLEIASKGKVVAGEILEQCQEARRSGLDEMKEIVVEDEQDKISRMVGEMPSTVEEQFENLVKSVYELERICNESIRRFEKAEEILNDTKNQFS